MKADRQSRVWPYVGLLICLFTLSVTAPKAWQRAALRYRQLDANQPDVSQRPAEIHTGDAVVQASSDEALPAPAPAEPNRYADVMSDSAGTVPGTDAPAQVNAETFTSPAANVRVSSSDDRLAMRMPHESLPEFAPVDEPSLEASPASDVPADPAADDTVANDTSASEESALIAENADGASPDIAAPEASTSEAEPLDPEVAAAESNDAPAEDAEISSLESSTLDVGEPPADTTIVEDSADQAPASAEPVQDTLSPPAAESTADVAVEDDQAEAPPEQDPANTLAWASPRMLLEQMTALEQVPAAVTWIENTRTLLDRLSARPLPEAEVRAEILTGLQAARVQIEKMAAAEQEWPNKASMLRVQYSLSRRLEIWQAIHILGAPPSTQAIADDQSTPRLARRISEMNASARYSRDGENWRRNLQLDALQYALRREDQTDEQRRRLAHVVLGRMAEARENPQQKAFAESPAAQQLDAALREWSSEEVHLCKLLEQLETFEENRSPHMAKLISQQRQSLIYSNSEIEQAVGKRIEQHYRNANVRLAISEDLMNRFLPKPQVFEAPVDDTIMGAAVSGHSRTLNKLHLRLIPDNDKIRLGLEAHGMVHSNTGASSGPVTIYNRGETSYIARKLILVGQSGMHVWPAVAEASAASDTEDIVSKYDGIPLFGSIVRNMAQTQQDEAYGDAMAEVEARVQDTARQRLDKEADPRIRKLGQGYERAVQGPLERLDLSPTPISLSTTKDRAIIRFRVAGDNQLGAHTPRPCAPSDSMASMQVHESVLNNVADQLGLNGQTFTLPALHRTVAEKLGLSIPEPEDLPTDAQVKFAAEDAVRIRCDDGKIWVTLSIAELSQGRRKYKNFQATAVYHLLSQGLHTELERDGVIQLAGQRLNLGEQIALRGVVSKLFSQNRRPQVISPARAADPRLAGLRVTQLVVADGWIGLAIAPDRLVRGKSPAGTSVSR